MPNAFDFTLTSLAGQPMSLAAYRGQALLIVNTASRCGFTGQYQGLQQLAERYAGSLTVIGVPSNDFAGQEPKGNAEIGVFCERNYGVTFPMAAKSSVIGKNAHPLFHWIRQEKGMLAGPYWNFYKYVIAPDGRVVDWFSPLTDPLALRLTQTIERVLP